MQQPTVEKKKRYDICYGISYAENMHKLISLVCIIFITSCATSGKEDHPFLGKTVMELGSRLQVEQTEYNYRLPLELYTDFLETKITVQGKDAAAYISSRRFMPLVSYRWLLEQGVAVYQYGLDIREGRFVAVGRAHEADVDEVYVARLPDLKFGSLHFTDIPVFVLDDREQELFPDGVIIEIGNMLWMDYPVRMDLQQGVLWTYIEQDNRNDAGNAPLYLSEYGLMYTEFRAEGLKRDLLLDLSSEDGIVVASTEIENFNQLYPERIRGFRERMHLFGGDSSALAPHYHIVPPVLKWGETRLNDAGFEIWTGNHVPDSMGIGFLLHFDIVLDLPSRQIRFVRYPAAPYAELMTYGFLADLYSGRIIRVYEGSVADETGMQVGSRIADLDEYFELMQTAAARGSIELILPDDSRHTAHYELEWMFPEAERGSLW